MSKSKGTLLKAILTCFLFILVSVGFSRNTVDASLTDDFATGTEGIVPLFNESFREGTTVYSLYLNQNQEIPPGVVDLQKTTLTASPNSIVADGVSQSIITVQLKDSDGNNITTSGGTLTLGTSAGTLGPVTDNNDGTYTAVLTSTPDPDLAVIVGRLNGDLISNSDIVHFSLDPNGDEDGDGVTNGIEIFHGTDYQDPCSFIPENQTVTPSAAWDEGDCDNDGLLNGDEKSLGTNPLDPDTDGDGVLDGTEVADDTDPLDECSFVFTSQILEPSQSWKSADCDSDGLTNQQEVELQTDLLNPDTDGDGVIDGTEVDDETDPLDACSFVLASQTLAPSQTWKDTDCDEDGLTNQQEVDRGTDPLDPDTDGDGVLDGTEITDSTDPLNQCSFVLASQTLEQDAAWKEADCDNDGLSNQAEKEIETNPLDPDTDGDGVTDGQEVDDETDPLDQCSFILASQTLPTDQSWKDADCDEDGLTNQEEVDRGTDPFDPDTDGDGVLDGTEVTDSTDPLDVCSYLVTSQTLEPEQAWKEADCDADGLTNQEETGLGTNPLFADSDGDGVTDGQEQEDGTDPLDLCSFVLESQTLATSQDWKVGDCDEDGLSNQIEVNRGTDVFDPDTDGDGVLDGTEVTDSTDPLDACSYLAESQTEEPKQAWNEADCDEDGLSNQAETELGTDPQDADTDGDGVTDGQEVDDETDPLDQCSFILASQTLPTDQSWNDADCDEDGLTNQDEVNRGTDVFDPDTDGDGVLDGTEVTDSTDPLDACSYLAESQTVEPNQAWKEADCDEDGLSNQAETELGTDPKNADTDGDGVTDGQEVDDETDPLDECSFVLESQTLAASQSWKDADCDEDGLTNQEEVDLGTDPLNPDSDGDGVLDGTEVSDNTDPLEACSFVLDNQETDPDQAWKDADCDNDGSPNQQEKENGTDPLNPDTDGDGVPDGTEVAEGTDPLDNTDFKDTDGDGVPNYIEEIQETDPENCSGFKDTDEDGVPDYVEEFDGTDPLDGTDFADSDSDGVSDYLADRSVASLSYETLILWNWGTAFTPPATVTAVLGDGSEVSVEVEWDEINVNQFESGTYIITGTALIEPCVYNTFDVSLAVEIEVMVLEKPAPEDLILDNNRFEVDVTSDFIYVGTFTVIDPVDDVHTIILNGNVLDNQYFEIVDGQLFWSSSEVLLGKNSFTIEVKVIDRVGNEFVKRFEIFRDRKSLSDIEIPNTFTPNGDGYNDDWGVRELLYYSNVKIQIFEKSGDRLFITTDPSVRWDGTYKGKDVPAGSYYWVIEIGETKESRRGILNLLRY
ncbi:invasin domain 3-containing protein [Algoriphagus sp. CAU 1675]|uniref:invasin domain 3-containing protein n=1 Tax=Algoriphagus sp. CAU 1675 TaxID=3032597 RepID=UPI0023DCD25B|nr:invasin domain 3-containing protein [Algoriphagus sp. CAU 1675]MDF2158552.1 invasin domain 3-containing protein [Algoriphagus sp. CAU 1675]